MEETNTINTTVNNNLSNSNSERNTVMKLDTTLAVNTIKNINKELNELRHVYCQNCVFCPFYDVHSDTCQLKNVEEAMMPINIDLIAIPATINNNNNEKETFDMNEEENDQLPPPPAEIKLEDKEKHLPTPQEISTAIIADLFNELEEVAHEDGGWHNFSTTVRILNIKASILDEVVNHWNEAEIPSADFFMNLLNEIEKESAKDYEDEDAEETQKQKVIKLEMRFWDNLHQGMDYTCFSEYPACYTQDYIDERFS